MKFGQTLATHLTPEWRKQYIAYLTLKDMILKAFTDAPINSNSPEYIAFVAAFDKNFFQVCAQQLAQIETFFAEKHAEAKRKYREFDTEITLLLHDRKIKQKSFTNIAPDLSKTLSKRKARQLKLALSEYYLSLILLRNYQTLNDTGFRKILKKHDKRLNTNSGAEWYSANVENAEFKNNAEITELIESTEAFFTKNLSNGDRSRAMKHLRVPPFEASPNPTRTFRLGFASGIWVCLLCFLLISAFLKPLPASQQEICFRIHNGSLVIIAFIFLFGANVYGWQKAGVNHVLIFEINPRDHLSHIHFMEIASYFGVFWTLSCLTCFYKIPNLTPNLCASLVILLMVAFWFNPFRLLWRSRLWLMTIAGRIIATPVFKVNFADFWLADQLTSLSHALIDMQFVMCPWFTKDWLNSMDDAFACVKDIEYITKAVILSLPAFLRIAQSLRRFFDTRKKFPFLVNAVKYATSFPVAGFAAAIAKNKEQYTRISENPYFWCYVVCRIINSIYTYTWDIIMDFGLLKKFSGENILLRDEIIYAPAFYYFAIVEDFIMRFLWAGTILITEFHLMRNVYVGSLTGWAEVLRRHIWNYIRLENEHLNNCGQFRAVRDISVRLVEYDDSKRDDED